MKILIKILLLFFSLNAWAQQASVLDSKSLIVPRYSGTSSIQSAITNPEYGMLVYNHTTQSFWYYNGAWQNLSIDATGNFWNASGSDIVNVNTGNVAINGALSVNSPSSSHQLMVHHNATDNFSRIGFISPFPHGLGWSISALKTFPNNNSRFIIKSENPSLDILHITGDGLVGIGTPNPTMKLSVNGDVQFNGLRVGRGSGNQFTNTVFGTSPLNKNTALGKENTAIGNISLFENTNGSFNTAVGSMASYGNLTGDNNTSIGYKAGFSATGSNNIAIGSMAEVAIPNASNQLSIGNWIYGTNGNIGIGLNNPSEKFEVSGKIKTLELQITSGSGNNKILTSDTNGNATWQTLSLPAPSQWTTVGSNINYSSGNVGILTATPTSTLDVNGSIATKIKKINTFSTVILDDTGSIWHFSSNPNVSLPTANSCENRRYILVNTYSAIINLNTHFIDFNGTQIFTINANSSIEIISDGTNWLQIK